MNSVQLKNHFQLMEYDSLVQELRRQIKRSTNSDIRAELRLKIYERSIELKAKVMSILPDNEQLTWCNTNNFSVPIDAFYLRKKLA